MLFGQFTLQKLSFLGRNNSVFHSPVHQPFSVFVAWHPSPDDPLSVLGVDFPISSRPNPTLETDANYEYRTMALFEVAKLASDPVEPWTTLLLPQILLQISSHPTLILAMFRPFAFLESAKLTAQ
jgi:hypothetical protein